MNPSDTKPPDRILGMPIPIAAALIAAFAATLTNLDRFVILYEKYIAKPPPPPSWTHFYTNSGDEAAKRLTLLGPSPKDVAASLSDAKTFHVWYRGGGTGTKYSYDHVNWDPSKATAVEVFYNNGTIIPIGFGSAGGRTTLAWFGVSK